MTEILARFGLQGKDVVTLLIALAALLISASNFLFVRRKDKTIQTYVFLNEWRNPEFYEITRYIRGNFRKELTSEKVLGGFRGLPDEEARKLRRVTHFLDYAGRAMQTGVVDKRIMLTTIGEPVLELWQILGGLILRERELNIKAEDASMRPRNSYKQRWQGGFEHIAEEARTFKQREAYRDKVYRGGDLIKLC